jgi:peptidyl-prolyl cis-trans isomerase D
VGATLKTSDLVGQNSQVPQLGALSQVAPQLFDLLPGNITGPINAGRTGVVVQIREKTEPSPDEIAKNFDQARDQLLEQRRSEAFEVFASNIISDYKKHNRVLFSAKSKTPEIPGE